MIKLKFLEKRKGNETLGTLIRSDWVRDFQVNEIFIIHGGEKISLQDVLW